MTERLKSLGIPPPTFVGIGDPEKLNLFLKNVPSVPKDRLFVDSYDFETYSAAGFGKIGDDKNIDPRTLTVPTLGVREMWKYTQNLVSLSPVPKGQQFRLGDVPEGVLRLGGVFVIKNHQIAYRHAEKVPGDHAPLEDVLQAAKPVEQTAQSESVLQTGHDTSNCADAKVTDTGNNTAVDATNSLSNVIDNGVTGLLPKEDGNQKDSISENHPAD